MDAVTKTQFMATRRSLVERLADWRDQKNWHEFFETYWKLIYSVATKAGLTDAEAQDVVQETIITVAKSIDGLKYDRAQGSFKGWLLHITRWRIADRFRRREPFYEEVRPNERDSDQTSAFERIPDPAGNPLEAWWDQEWEKTLTKAALDRTKRLVEAKQYQVFELYTIREWPVRKIAEVMRINQILVRVTTHRVSRVLKKQYKELQKKYG